MTYQRTRHGDNNLVHNKDVVRAQTLGRAPVSMADSLAKHDLGADYHARHGRYQAITMSGIYSVTSALIPDI